MAVGNQCGLSINEAFSASDLFRPMPGAILVQAESEDFKNYLREAGWEKAAELRSDECFTYKEEKLDLEDAAAVYEGGLEEVYPQAHKAEWASPDEREAKRADDEGFAAHLRVWLPDKQKASPLVLIPLFPGSNCEYDSAVSFERAGARCETLVIRNLSPEDLAESIERLEDGLRRARMRILLGGCSGGDARMPSPTVRPNSLPQPSATKNSPRPSRTFTKTGTV